MRQARFTATLSKASTSAVAVAYATVAGTAEAGVDFTPTTGTVTFEPGELTKPILVPIRDADLTSAKSTFSLTLSDPDGATVGIGGSLICTIPGTDEEETYSMANRFRRLYNNLHDVSNGYYGPPSGPTANSLPYHCIETLICEAPDWGHESVSETVSFAVGLEAHKGLLDGDWTGYNKVWNTIDTVYVPNATNQPQGTYTPSSPADYTPEGDLPSAYPVLGQPTAANGTDGLYNELKTTYGNDRMYLMHWMIDVDGAFGYKNGDGTTTNVYINNYSRGLQESAFETITHPEWEDFTQGGQTNQSKAGYLPIYAQSLPDYPAAPFAYSKQWRYTCAPDAEARAVQWAFWGSKWGGANVTASDTKAKKMGDYLRYSLMDKYFRQIGANRAQGSTDADPYTACHYLISWYVSWGGEIPATGTGTWSFRIGSSECHQGYQAPDIAYYMATGGGGYSPLSPSAGDIWLGSLYRQIEMLRWLQTEQGLIAGGVSNSWKGRYETPNDGRQTAMFYGMYYTYAPVWHDPPSNNWFGFQTWGMQRVADLFLEVSDKNTTLANTVRQNCGVIMDRWINWVLNNVTVDDETREFSVPNNLKWTSEVQTPDTTTAPNLEGKYEYIPTLNWTGQTDGQAAFWNASTVPNPGLKFTVDSSGVDLGVAASLISVLAFYAQAKRVQGKFTDVIPNNQLGKTAEDCFNLAVKLSDSLWYMYRDEKGLARPEQRADYNRYNDPIYIPPGFTGVNKTGDAMANGQATFISLRSWQKEDPDWPMIQNYIDNPSETNIPVFTYHRFWATAEYAMACATLSHYFSDLLPEEDQPSIDL